MSTSARANIIGAGLIGGSLGLALRQRGWHVSGYDSDSQRLNLALEKRAIDVAVAADALDQPAEITFVATTVGAIPAAAAQALAQTSSWVADVGSVKAPLLSEIKRAQPQHFSRFVGGHPMAGSEQEGLDGSSPDMFKGAIWVLTPTDETDDSAYVKVRSVIASLGAEVVTMTPKRHDELVALISHVPHLTAATLMCLADERSDQREQLQRLAAGGFRDMTRIAAGHPGIWPDICLENKAAICDGLDKLTQALTEIRQAVASGDRAQLLEHLHRARTARLNLPGPIGAADDLLELRVVIPDRPGEVARLTTVASEIQANIYDLEIAHSPEGQRGVLIMLLNSQDARRLQAHLKEIDYSATLREVE